MKTKTIIGIAVIILGIYFTTYNALNDFEWYNRANWIVGSFSIFGGMMFIVHSESPKDN